MGPDGSAESYLEMGPDGNPQSYLEMGPAGSASYLEMGPVDQSYLAVTPDCVFQNDAELTGYLEVCARACLPAKTGSNVVSADDASVISEKRN